jgi:hypothetical protein
MSGTFFIIRRPVGCPCHSLSLTVVQRYSHVGQVLDWHGPMDGCWTDTGQWTGVGLTRANGQVLDWHGPRTNPLDRPDCWNWQKSVSVEIRPVWPCTKWRTFMCAGGSHVRHHVMQTDEVLTTEPCVYDVMLCYVMLCYVMWEEQWKEMPVVFGCCCCLVGKK